MIDNIVDRVIVCKVMLKKLDNLTNEEAALINHFISPMSLVSRTGTPLSLLVARLLWLVNELFYATSSRSK